MTGVLIKRGETQRQSQREDGHVKTEAEVERFCHKPGNTWGHQELEEAGGVPPGGFGGSLPCPHLDLGLWPRTVREYILVSQAPQFVVLCYN